MTYTAHGAIGLAVVTVVGVGACKRGPEPAFVEGDLPVEVLQLAAPPQSVTYERKRVVGQIGLPVQAVRETWTRVSAEPLGVHYDATIGVEAEGASRVTRRFRYGADGLVLIAEGPVDGAGEVVWEPWVPPATVLPADPLRAAPWSAEHQVGGKRVTRACEVQPASDVCEGAGVVVVCDADWPGFRLATRDHFCRGVGWAGYESLVVRDAHPSVRTWTEGVRRLD